MSVKGGPNTVTSGLVLELDAGNIKSYQSGSTTWFDKSGFANNGTLINGVSYTSSFNGSLVFDGVNDWTSVTSQTNLVFGAGDFSLNIWFQISTLKGYQAMVCKPGNSDYNGWILYCETNNTIGFLAGKATPGVWEVVLNPGFTPTTNTWYNYQIVRNGTSWIMYRNATQVASTTASLTVGDVGNPVNIGRYLNFPGGVKYFSGNISILSLYGKAFSAAEVLQNYNALKTRFGL